MVPLPVSATPDEKPESVKGSVPALALLANIVLTGNVDADATGAAAAGVLSPPPPPPQAARKELNRTVEINFEYFIVCDGGFG